LTSVATSDAAAARRRRDVPALLALLVDTDRVTRVAAAQDLGDLRDVAAVGPLVRCLQAGDELLRLSSLKALAKIGDPGVVPAVHQLAVHDESFGVRATAAETLGRLGDPRAVSLLLAMLRERGNPWPQSYRKWLAKLLVELRAREAIPELVAAKSGAHPLTRWRLAQAIRTLRKSD
jgi:HEAT repeat protein